jgi:hypothetical protein
MITHIIPDEIIVEVKMGIAWEVAMILKDCMEYAFRKLMLDVSFKGD